ncbi:MAG: TIGR04348 family glycosyltransferase [Planctomycetes bacterium]|nr:TIGR04348 family glycosyltransferase [Planctomycetota bacterium]
MGGHIAIWTPATPHSRSGNRVTALRIALLLRRAGRTVSLHGPGEAGAARADVLLALHAFKCARVARRWRMERGAAPLVVLLSGTDLYVDALEPATRADFSATLATATRVVALQPRALVGLPPEIVAKTRVILQSARPWPGGAPSGPRFDVVQLAHLRAVKDPLLAAHAARLLPRASRLQVRHLGAALDPELAAEARAEMERNPRYHWLGERPRADALQLVAGARAFVQTSRAEGGSNAVVEALVSGTPVLATRIEGNVGQLGADHPGLFEVGDAQALAALLERLEREPALERSLRARSGELAARYAPERESEAWRALLAEFGL